MAKRERSKQANGGPAIRNRVLEVRQVDPSTLLPSPLNPRAHGSRQREAFRAVLAEIGFAGALLARKKGRQLELIDGHLRAEEMPKGGTVPVVVVDLDEEEARKLMAVYDPLAAMAEIESAALQELASMVGFENASLQSLFDELVASDPLRDAGAAPPGLRMGDRDPIQQMTFTLHDAQVETVKAAITKAKAAAKRAGGFGATGNENSNGNALALICEAFLKRR